MIDSGTLLQDRFLIEEKIGMGGMGAVYRALDQKFGSQVAIKETFYGDSQIAEAFEREARLLNGLHHPIFPHVSDYFSQNGGHFLVMEFIEGEDLSEILKRGEIFPVNTVIRWAFDILDGLDYLHSQDPPIIHRDIKPNNLKLTSRGRIVLLDFGMAKETSPNTLGAKSVFGYSRRYSPLEQIEGAGTDVRSDIYSLGASIYHLLTGQPAADALARASALVGGRPDPLIPANEINPDVPASVAEIISKALALNPDNRFESADEMADELERAVDDAPAHPIGPVIPAEADEIPLAAATAGASSAGEPEWAEEFDDDTEPISITPGQRIPGAAAGTSTSTRSKYVLWVPILLLFLGAGLFATYRILTGEEGASNAATYTPTEQATNAAEPAISEVPADTVVAEDDPPTSETVPDRDELSDRTDESVMALAKERASGAADSQRSNSAAPGREQKVADPVRSRDRKDTDNKKPAASAERRTRRPVTPAFQPPAVSSIEAIFTGVPYERRRQWEADERERWIQEDIRRRQLRRMRRENRRRLQEPF